ncbi:MAG: hypothetical protein C5B59_10520 [Bacteroidetes bacterium]|nr:MAG: hypothetical protein C5B59_10520 [Bacteroidota bacterium]
MKNKSTRGTILAICFALAATSCGPKIFYFRSNQYTIAGGDSVQLTWSVRGTPTLLAYTDTAAPEEKRPEYRNYHLVVHKNGKEIMKQVQVIILPIVSEDDIVFSTIRKGDSVIASGIKDTTRWGTFFKLQTVASGSGRTLTVMHGGKMVVLEKDRSSSAAFVGIANSGFWVISSPLSDAEKKDTTLVPARLKIHTVIVHQKP